MSSAKRNLFPPPRQIRAHVVTFKLGLTIPTRRRVVGQDIFNLSISLRGNASGHGRLLMGLQPPSIIITTTLQDSAVIPG